MKEHAKILMDGLSSNTLPVRDWYVMNQQCILREMYLAMMAVGEPPKAATAAIAEGPTPVATEDPIQMTT